MEKRSIKNMNIMYTNADNLYNKMDELKLFLQNASQKPNIIAITEVRPKHALYTTNLNLPGYSIFFNDAFEKCRGIVIYVEESLSVKLCDIKIDFEEYVAIEIVTGNSPRRTLQICIIYRGPNSSPDNNQLLFELINQFVLKTKEDDGLLFVGDFNFPTINWELGTSSSRAEIDFIELLRENFLSQHVMQPTRARSDDVPHILDLIITNDSFINDIQFFAPLGNSDHSVLCATLETSGVNREVFTSDRLNYSKGDYSGLNEYLDINWDEYFEENYDDVEILWEKFKTRIVNAATLFIPTVKKFSGSLRDKWKRPLPKDIRQKINKKNKLWKKFIKTKKTSVPEELKKLEMKLKK